MVAELLMVAGQAEDIVETQGRGAEDVALQRDPVASRQTICIMGSKPICFRRTAAPMLDILTTLVWLSVTLTASTYPFR